MYNSVSTNYVKVLNNSLLANVGEVMFNKNGLESLTTLLFASYTLIPFEKKTTSNVKTV